MARKYTVIKGISASPGISIGKAFLLDSEVFNISRRKILEEEIPQEIVRLEDALIQAKKGILKLQRRISKRIGAERSEIFNAHLLVLEDRSLIEEVISRLKKEKLVVEYIFLRTLEKYIKAFSKIDDEYIKERTIDIEDVGKRVLRNLLGKQRQTLRTLEEGVIVIAYDLSPSDTASMHKEKVIAFATEIGSRTSHTAIMARALEIPATVGLEDLTQKVKPQDTVIVDGNQGIIIITPPPRVIAEYEKRKAILEEFENSLLSLRDLPAETLDGHRVRLVANIELPEEVPSALEHGAKGIGLYRTEYLYIDRQDLPDEEEQYEAYRKVVEEMSPYPVVIRTLDLGGDKFLSQLKTPREMNPFLGWRAIRFCLAQPEIFKVQLRAILRAASHRDLDMMYPMISNAEEFRLANQILLEAKEELKKKKVDFKENMRVGIMIETPSAAIMCDILAEEAAIDFFSIGTNDLIQYSFAVDRVNEKVAYLYEPTSPAILRLVKNIIDAAHKARISVSMCGEMASDVSLALLLVGLGLDELSVSPIVVPDIKKVVRSINFSRAKEFAERCLKMNSGKEVKFFLRKELKHLVPEMIPEEHKNVNT